MIIGRFAEAVLGDTAAPLIFAHRSIRWPSVFMKSVLIIIDYFGTEFPEWIDLFFESCRWNPTIDWLIHADCETNADIPKNVTIRQIEWGDYMRLVSVKLGINFQPSSSYKICDIRPALGIIWDKDVEGYDFFGYGDVDVIYGNIRYFFNDEILENHNVFSTHEWGISGHLCLMRNVPWIKHAYSRVKGWQRLFEMPDYTHFDEGHFFRAFFQLDTYSNRRFPLLHWIVDWLNPSNLKYRRGAYMKEQFTTPLVPALWCGMDVQHSHLWFWQDGRVTNDTNDDREFIYLHFMNFKNARHMDASFGAVAPWSKLTHLVGVEKSEIGAGFSIGLSGFQPLSYRHVSASTLAQPLLSSLPLNVR
jgi:hypothetical protein